MNMLWRYNACVYCVTFCNFLSVYMFVLYCVVCSSTLEEIKNTYSYWRKYVHEVLVNRLGGRSLPRKSVVRLSDSPDMTLDIYRGRKTTKHNTHTLMKSIEKLN